MKLKLEAAFFTWSANEKNSYVLNVACLGQHILAHLSDDTVVIFDSNSFEELARHHFVISVINAHLMENGNVVVVGKKGQVILLDTKWTRSTEIISLAAEDIVCSAISHDQARLAVGTEKTENITNEAREQDDESHSDSGSEDGATSSILLIDLRRNTQLGAYTEAHSDTINWLAFHPDNNDRLLSGGADGLVNWFDLSQPNEEEALVQTFDCGSSLSRVGWIRDAEHGTGTFAVTDDNRLTLFDVADEEGDATVVFKTVNFKEGRSLVDCFTDDEAVYSLSSDDSGKAYLSRRQRSNGYATALTIDDHCHSQIVRCLGFHGRSQTLLTGGEDGKIVGRQVVFERDPTVAKKTRRSKKKGSRPY